MSEETQDQNVKDLQQTLGWMDLVIGNIDDSVCVTDKKGSILFANNAFANLLHTNRVFLLGQTYKDVFNPVSIPVPIKEYSEAAKMDESNTTNKIYNWDDPTGKPCVFRIKTRKLKALRQTVYLIQDITSEYSLVRSRSDIISLASHQLRTPITAIMNYAHMLNDGYAGPLSEAQKNLTEALVMSSERMINLIDDLLNIARIQNDRYELKKTSVDIAALVNDILVESAIRLESKELTVKTYKKSKSTVLETDNFIVFEVISNLLSNAIQYSYPKTEILITIAPYKDGLSISIKDQGIGIRKKDQTQIFKQFYRSEEAFELYPQGTGLGMHLIKLMLEKLGGSIKVESQFKKGSVFTVFIPELL
jgi:signal transduction histidine kinase